MHMKSFLSAICTTLFVSSVVLAQTSQTQLVIVGDVRTEKSGEPLAHAMVAVKGQVFQTLTDENGTFRLLVPSVHARDTIRITYLGYRPFEKPIPQLASTEHVLMTEVATMLEEVTVTYRPLDLRSVDRAARPVRAKLFALDAEVTNNEYLQFLVWLDDHNQHELRLKYEFDLSKYNTAMRAFYKRYHSPGIEKRKKNKPDTIGGFGDYPAVNVTYEGAVAYCQWLTERYNENPKKKKFKSVKFRLPTRQEWQTAALGNPNFQSWNVLENTIEVVVADDPNSLEMLKGTKKTVHVDDTFLYPWYSAWYYRNKPQNSRNCFLGNFFVEDAIPCPSGAPAFDGFVMTAPGRSYFPNNMGFYDVVGNVAEMIVEKGKAAGGSWKDSPSESTIFSLKHYDGADESVGFRLFLEVE